MLEMLANVAGVLGGIAIIVTFIAWLRRVWKRRAKLDGPRSLLRGKKASTPIIHVNVSRKPWVADQDVATIISDALYSGRQNRSPACAVVISEVSSFERKLANLEKYSNLTEDQKRQHINLHDVISSLKKKQDFMQKGLDILLKPDVIRILDYPLTKDGWRDFIIGFFHLVEMGSSVDPGFKIDVWRTNPPKLSAPIRVTDEEMKEIMRNCEVSEPMDLSMGPWNFNANQLPPSVQISKSLPRILYEITSYYDKLAPNTIPNLFLMGEWNIGLG